MEKTFKSGEYLRAKLGQYFHGSDSVRQKNKRNKEIVSLRNLFCICFSLHFMSLQLIRKLTMKRVIFPLLTSNLCC